MSRMVTAPGRARQYETIYILKPDVDAESAEKVGQRVQDVVTRESGKLTKVELWGRRRLAYDLAKHKRGVYVYLKYLGDGRVVAEVERNLRLSDTVLKYQTVLVDYDLAAEAEVAAEDVKFERLELPPVEDDREDSRERQLGLIEPDRSHRHEGHDPDDIEADGDGDKEDEEL